MQVNSNQAAAQIAQSTQMMNQLNQTIVDKSQDISNKLLNITVEDKLALQDKMFKLNLLA